MQVTLNGSSHTVPEGCTVSALAPNQRGVAVAVNQQIVPRSQWPTAQLCDGDRIEILEAAPGG
ncbi:MAG: sulfur carrier protein ThiS [bacterium]|nr:sulfur carrier protein ThiS [bacterium]